MILGDLISEGTERFMFFFFGGGGGKFKAVNTNGPLTKCSLFSAVLLFLRLAFCLQLSGLNIICLPSVGTEIRLKIAAVQYPTTF